MCSFQELVDEGGSAWMGIYGIDRHDESASLAAFHQVALGHFTTKH
jgi:hypothetical protein